MGGSPVTSLDRLAGAARSSGAFTPVDSRTAQADSSDPGQFPGLDTLVKQRQTPGPACPPA